MARPAGAVMRDKRTFVPGTSLYYWHRERFLAACAPIRVPERRFALQVYRASVDEHLAAADEAVAVMRRAEGLISKLRYVRPIAGTSTYEIGWKNDVRRQRLMLRYDR